MTQGEPSAQTHRAPRRESNPRGWRLEVALLLLLVLSSAALRIDFALRCPFFDRQHSEGILTTDPAHIAYVTDRIVQAGGGVPSDFHADPRLEHPEVCDIPAMFTVGQEFVIAWVKLLVGDAASLHVIAVWVMSLCAALVVIGAWGVTRELTGSRWWGLGAALLWVALPTSYRTLGFVFIREDFSLPFYALHLWLVARACRMGGNASRGLLAGAGAAAGLAAATWHAMGSFLLIEAAAVVLWFVRSGQNPLAGRRAGWFAAPLLALGLLVPVLRAKGFVLSLPMTVVLALLVAGVVRRRGLGRGAALLTAAGIGAALATVGVGVSQWTGSGLGDYAHVFELLLAKLHHFGARPADPDALTFGSRLLWQGPFETAPASLFVNLLGPALILAAAAVVWTGRGWVRPTVDKESSGRHGLLAVLAALLVASFLVSWLFQRTHVLAGLLTAIGGAWVLASLPRQARLIGPLLLLSVIGWQGGVQLRTILSRPYPWWTLPNPERVAERRHMVEWVRANVPPGEPIAAEYVTATGLLYHTRHPALIQPKYETARSRDRIEAFLDTFYGKSLPDFRSWLAEQDCRWFVFDKPWIWGARWVAGIHADERQIGGAAAWFLSPDRYREIPGFRLMYESPPRFGLGTFRVYRANNR